VKLNFIKTNLRTNKSEKFCIQRGLKSKTDPSSGEATYFNEFIVNENHDRPLLFEEYKELLQSAYDLDVQEFAIYQNQLEKLCFGEDSGAKLTRMFEKLSGSQEHKERYNELKAEIAGQESEMKKASDKLKEFRHEKIKIKGLSDFQKQIEECVAEQRDLESILVSLGLLQAATHCKEISNEQSEIKVSLEKTNKDRQGVVTELKQLEAQLRKIENSHSDRHRQLNRLR